MPAVAFDIEFPLNTAGLLTHISRATLRQAEYSHEMLIIDTLGQDLLDLRTNAPVQATLSDGLGHSIDFVGYVHHVRDDLAKHAGQQSQRVVCIGPTWRLRQQRQRVWQDLTASEIVETILREHQLTADVQRTNVRLHHRVQSVSDWDFIVRLAKECGFVVYPRNTIVHFHARKRQEDQKVATSPVFTYRTALTGYADAEVAEFRPLLGEDLPHSQGRKASRVVLGVDPRNATTLRGTHDGRPDTSRRTDNVPALFESSQNEIVVNSSEEAAQRAEGASAVAMWQHRADADTLGNVTVRPTGFVYMDEVPSHYEGFWAVLAVDHVFTPARYRLRMSLGTDSLGANVGGYKPPPFPLVNGQQVPSSRSKPTSSVLSLPGNFDSIALKRSAGGPAPLTWRGTSAVVRDAVGQTKKESTASLAAKARRYRNVR